MKRILLLPHTLNPHPSPGTRLSRAAHPCYHHLRYTSHKLFLNSFRTPWYSSQLRCTDPILNRDAPAEKIAKPTSRVADVRALLPPTTCLLTSTDTVTSSNDSPLCMSYERNMSHKAIVFLLDSVHKCISRAYKKRSVPIWSSNDYTQKYVSLSRIFLEVYNTAWEWRKAPHTSSEQEKQILIYPNKACQPIVTNGL